MTAVKSGLMIIDQRRLGVVSCSNSISRPSARLFPEVVQFPMSEKVIFKDLAGNERDGI